MSWEKWGLISCRSLIATVSRKSPIKQANTISDEFQLDVSDDGNFPYHALVENID